MSTITPCFQQLYSVKLSPIVKDVNHVEKYDVYILSARHAGTNSRVLH